ncbi:MAG: Phthiocerol/phenolphthiocerol synthesis polyketide synthase type I PpsB [candidate division BRC1 bacterium ADurb.BinA292]|nr:MAG: Phthiocerol/phenolphthiocerol synthesis polyketide synthase type I PpsB [candidate division BRC1 bacterium ADurb.BinA292]
MPGTNGFAVRLAAAGPEQRAAILRETIAREVADVLGFASPDAVDPAQGFFAMGMNSILTLQLHERLEGLLGRRLPPTLAFEHPTVEALFDYLAHEVFAREMNGLGGADTASTAGRTASGAAQTEEELMALLEERLEGLNSREGSSTSTPVSSETARSR